MKKSIMGGRAPWLIPVLLLGTMARPGISSPRVLTVLPAESGAPALPVLCYHKFGKESGRDNYQMSPRRFEGQLAWLKKNGYTYLSLTQVAAFVGGTLKSPPEKPFCLTIDDGWDSGFYVAAPLLKKYGFRAVFMVVTESQEWKKRISWSMMKTLEKEGFEIASHSFGHSKLFRPGPGESVAGYRQRLKKELAGSKAMMEARLGHPVTALAYPYGGYNHTVEGAARRAGYKMIFTVTRGMVMPGDNPLRLKRLMILAHGNADLFTPFMKIKPLPVVLEGLEDGGGWEYTSMPKSVTFSPGVDLKPGLLEAGVDGRALVLEKKGGVLVAKIPGLIKPGLHFLHLDLKRGGEDYEARWLFQVYFKKWGKYFDPEGAAAGK